MCSVLAVHPHMRGEHPPCVHMASPSHGSSPHAWGTPLTPFLGITNIRFIPTCVGNTRARRACSAQECRFIPTCVGNTIARLTRRNNITVHPHMRGEHAQTAFSCTCNHGSSPHAWGTRVGHTARSTVSRLIPTCVGNT